MNTSKNTKIQAILKLKEKRQRLERERCKNDKFYWLTNYVYTLDPHDKDNSVKLFPNKEYFRELIKVYEQENLLLLEKSRQMMMTWLFIALSVHEVQFNSGRHVFIQSKKEQDANTLLDRAKHIYTHQPDWLKPEPKPKDTFLKLKIKSNSSQIIGIPEGGDQIRTHTASLIFSDEVGFQPEFEDAYAAALPCVKGGGKFIGVSTAKPTYFYDLTREEGKETVLMSGYWEVINGKKAFIKKKYTPKGNCVLTLHYTADPNKRTQEWKESEMLGFKTEEGGTDAKWEQEYEINYEARGGTPVYPELEGEYSDILIEPFEIPEWWNKYGCIDPGTRNPTAVEFITIDPEGRLFIYWELYEKELHYLQLCRLLEEHPDFKNVNRHGFMIDPASAQKISQQTSGIKSFKEILQGEGLNVEGGNRDREKGAEKIRELIRKRKLFIFNTCPNLWGELKKLRYEEWKGVNKAEKNVKESIVAKDDHAWSALRYFIMSPYVKSKKPLTGVEAKIKKLQKQRSNAFNKHYRVK